MPNPRQQNLILALCLIVLVTMPVGVSGGGAKTGVMDQDSVNFTAPLPGTYSLPDLGAAGDGDLVDSGGQKIRLGALLSGKLTLLSFIYASCSDVNGCPLATLTLQKTARQLASKLKHIDQVRFLTLSIHPETDTPEVMERYGKPFRVSGVDWKFLTPFDQQSLEGILKGYGQNIEPEIDAQGQKTGGISHVLRVFLIDQKGRIRNSYTPSVLHRDLLLADLATLEMTAGAEETPTGERSPAAFKAGDDKAAYDRSDYRTHSESLLQRKGRRLGLLEMMKAAKTGLPDKMPGQAGALSEKTVKLGRKLFFDRRLSFNGTLSCAMCHIPEQGFASQEQATSVGIEGRVVRRNAPTLLNVGFLSRLFLDGRENRLENQVWGPLLAHNEMGNPSIGTVLTRIEGFEDYKGLFETAFGRGPTLENLGIAIAQYERTLVAGASPFDLWYYGKNDNAVSEDVKRGFSLFTGRAGCSQCHWVGKDSSLLTDESFHNTGIRDRGERGEGKGRTRVQLAPGVFTELEDEKIQGFSESLPSDLGRTEVSQDPRDLYKFRTPGLRNVALTFPYMHDGSIATLEQVIDFYQNSPAGRPGVDPLIHPLDLDAQDRKDLLAFLNALTSTRVDRLVEDAWGAPVGDPGGS